MKRNYIKHLFIFFSVFIFIILLCSSCSCKGEDNDTINVERVEITNVFESINIGESVVLESTVYPANADNSVTWKVDSDCLTLNGNTITAIKEGTCVITVTSNQDQSKSDSIVVNVVKPLPSSIEINYDKDTIYIGETLDFSTIIYPEFSSQEITYSLVDDQDKYEVATFDGHTLTALKQGTIFLTISSKANPRVFETISITVLHECLEEESFLAKSIVGSFGEDASTMYNINYHINNIVSYALVTTSDDPTFENAKAYYGSGYYYEEIDEKTGANFEERNVWRINVTNLSPNTEYIYKINNGNDTYSDVYKFRTAGGDDTTFLFFTDTHYYAGTTGTLASAAVSEELIKNAVSKNPNINFILHGGDMIDSGGDDDIWDIFFNCAQSLKTLPYISVPGNHEYYTSGTTMSDNRYFKIFSAGPKNGAETLRESACWFKYNDTLFIMVDSVRTYSYNEQLKWMANLLENQEYKYSVICFHYPVNLDTTDYDANFIDIFDKYSVDLVLSGHYHSESMRINYYNDSKTTDEHLGTTYLSGSFSGIKSASTPENAINEARGYIINITDSGINIQTIYADGDLGKSWDVTNRAGEEVISCEKDELISSIKYELLSDTNQAKFSWSNKFYGNVKKVTITEILRGEIKDYAVFPSSSYTSITLDNIIPEYDYLFEVRIDFEDGSHKVLYFKENLHTPINLQLSSASSSINVNYSEVTESMKYIVKKISIYVDDELVTTYSYLNGITPNLSYLINNLESNKEYKITLKATTMAGKVIFSEEQTIKTN